MTEPMDADRAGGRTDDTATPSGGGVLRAAAWSAAGVPVVLVGVALASALGAAHARWTSLYEVPPLYAVLVRVGALVGVALVLLAVRAATRAARTMVTLEPRTGVGLMLLCLLPGLTYAVSWQGSLLAVSPWVTLSSSQWDAAVDDGCRALELLAVAQGTAAAVSVVAVVMALRRGAGRAAAPPTMTP